MDSQTGRQRTFLAESVEYIPEKPKQERGTPSYCRTTQDSTEGFNTVLWRGAFLSGLLYKRVPGSPHSEHLMRHLQLSLDTGKFGANRRVMNL